MSEKKAKKKKKAWRGEKMDVAISVDLQVANKHLKR